MFEVRVKTADGQLVCLENRKQHPHTALKDNLAEV